MKITHGTTSVSRVNIVLTSEEVEEILLASIKKELKSQGANMKDLDKAQVRVEVPYHEGNCDTSVQIVFPEKIESWNPAD